MNFKVNGKHKKESRFFSCAWLFLLLYSPGIFASGLVHKVAEMSDFKGINKLYSIMAEDEYAVRSMVIYPERIREDKIQKLIKDKNLFITLRGSEVVSMKVYKILKAEDAKDFLGDEPVHIGELNQIGRYDIDPWANWLYLGSEYTIQSSRGMGLNRKLTEFSLKYLFRTYPNFRRGFYLVYGLINENIGRFDCITRYTRNSWNMETFGSLGKVKHLSIETFKPELIDNDGTISEVKSDIEGVFIISYFKPLSVFAKPFQLITEDIFSHDVY